MFGSAPHVIVVQQTGRVVKIQWFLQRNLYGHPLAGSCGNVDWKKDVSRSVLGRSEKEGSACTFTVKLKFS